MVKYAKDEIDGVTELGKSLGGYLDKVITHTFSKIAIIRRNQPEAVIADIGFRGDIKEVHAKSKRLRNNDAAHPHYP